MNLIMLDSDGAEAVLPSSDPRADHVLNVLRREPGDTFDVGFVDGRVGKARLLDVSDAGLRLSVEWTGEAAELHPVTMIIGMPRPQTARRLLRELTALGVRRLVFCDTERSEPGYKHSKLWTSGEYHRHVTMGAEQAFNPRLPDVELAMNPSIAIEAIDSGAERIAMDNYESPDSLSAWQPARAAVSIALGAERGWTSTERDLLRESGFSFFHLGERVLRIETAAIACVAIALSRMGRI